MTNVKWKYQEYPKGSPADHARVMAELLELRGMQVVDNPADPMSISIRWADLVQAFADTADDVVDEYVRRHKEKAAHIDAHAINSAAPEEQSGTPDRISAQSLIVYFNDGSERIIHTHHPMIQQHGWRVRQINGVPFLIFGHGVPRQMIPLCNVKSFDISEELL